MSNREKLEEYLNTYGSKYPRSSIEYIKEHFEEGLMYNNGAGLLRQIYSALSLIPKELDIYQGFLENIKKYFSLNQSILEIASGRYPALARLIDLEQQKLGKGSITIYDKRLVTTNLGNIIIHKSLYEIGSERDKHSLIIGTASCEATELIIKKSNERRTNLYLALCGCIHSRKFCTTKSWHTYLYKMLKRTLEVDAELIVDHLDSRYNFPYPILIKKQREFK